jgi:hypothetical protein
MTLRVGQRVTHPEYGPGVVLAIRSLGRVNIRFDGRSLLPITLPAAELESGGNGRPLPPVFPGEAGPAAPAPEPVPPEVLPDLRQAIEALRLGIVPRGYSQEYTVARERELAAFTSHLDAGGGLALVWGDYGTGKTHLLDVYEQVALSRGFVTSRVTLDPKETPPSHPQRLFREIVRSLCYPGDPGEGLDPLFHRLATSPDHRDERGSRRSRVLSPVLYAFSHPDSEAARWVEDYIEGYPMDLDYGERELRRIGWRGPRPLALSDFRTYGRMYVNLVGTIARWAEDAGFAGLAVLFDEVEYIDMIQGESRRLAAEVLRHYAAATLPRERLAFDPDHLYRGGKAVHREIPLRFCDDQRLLVVMALTPLPEAEAVARTILADREEELRISSLTGHDFEELVRRVVTLYRRAWPGFDPPGSLVARIAEGARETSVLGDPSPREIVRETVMEMDHLRLTAGAERG